MKVSDLRHASGCSRFRRLMLTLSLARGMAGRLFLAALLLGAGGCTHLQPGRPEPAETAARSESAPALTFTNSLNPKWLEPSVHLFTLGPGDQVQIEVLGDASTKTTTVVGPDGKIYFNLLPGIDVWGLTLAQAKARLEHAYQQFVRERPNISIVLRHVASKRIWILGRVNAPGVYTLDTPTTLLEAISRAGGTMELSSLQGQGVADVTQKLADLQRSFVLRGGKCLPVDFTRLLQDGDLSQNIYLQPDDFIYLPSASAQQVYVLGAVTQPRAVPYQPGMTVAAAVAGAYGTLKDAYLNHVALVRGSFSRPRITIINLRAVLHGQAGDQLVNPNDIVYVPLSPYRYLKRYLNIILDTFASSSAIYEGESVVGTPTHFTGGVFIPVGSGIQVIPPTAPPAIH
jgi:polysaccharide biosynthesis/export protein